MSKNKSSVSVLMRRLIRLTGPVLSVLFHIGLFFLLVALIVIKPSVKEEQNIEITYMDENEIVDLLDTLDELPDETSPDKDPADQENLVTEREHENVEQPALPSELQQPSLSLDTISPLKLNLGQSDFEQLSTRRQTAFGAASGAGGDLIGTLYDFKRTPSGKARELNFPQNIRSILDRGFSSRAFRDFFTVPKPIYFNYLLMNKISASEGPKAFGAEEYMEPSQFIIHYHGEIQAPASGNYRFVGEFDDILLVLIDGKVVLEAGWGQKVSEWQPIEFVNQHACYTGHPLVYGSWVEFSAAKPRRIDMIIGEEPGGYIGGLLMIQREGIHYQTVENGRPLLPLFTVQPLTAKDRLSIASFGVWRFDPNPPPVMGRRRDVKLSAVNDEVTVTIQ